MDEPSDHDTLAAILYRDPVASILFGIALFLIVLLLAAGAFFARSGRPELLETALVLTGMFALVGAAVGLVRGLRSGRATTRRSALSGTPRE